jgi:hypothetical protein
VSKPSNEKIERHYFEQFSKAYALPEGCVIYGDKPDVIVHGTKKIGVEITNFFVKSGRRVDSEQRQQPLRQTVIEEAQKLYLAGGGRKIELSFSFDKNSPINQDNKRKLSSNLAEFAHSIDSRASGMIARGMFRNTMPEVASIYVNSKEYPDAKWRITQVHTFGLTSKDDLEAIVRDKESKVAGYEICDALWLLIVVDGINAAQEQQTRNDLRIRSNVFDRIFLYHTAGSVVVLKSD